MNRALLCCHSSRWLWYIFKNEWKIVKFRYFFSAHFRIFLSSFDVSSIEKTKNAWFSMKISYFLDAKVPCTLPFRAFSPVLERVLLQSGTIVAKWVKNDEKVWKSGTKNVWISCTICARIFDMAYKMAIKNTVNLHMVEISDFEPP